MNMKKYMAAAMISTKLFLPLNANADFLKVSVSGFGGSKYFPYTAELKNKSIVIEDLYGKGTVKIPKEYIKHIGFPTLDNKNSEIIIKDKRSFNGKIHGNLYINTGYVENLEVPLTTYSFVSYEATDSYIEDLREIFNVIKMDTRIICSMHEELKATSRADRNSKLFIQSENICNAHYKAKESVEFIDKILTNPFERERLRTKEYLKQNLRYIKDRVKKVSKVMTYLNLKHHHIGDDMRRDWTNLREPENRNFYLNFRLDNFDFRYGKITLGIYKNSEPVDIYLNRRKIKDDDKTSNPLVISIPKSYFNHGSNELKILPRREKISGSYDDFILGQIMLELYPYP